MPKEREWVRRALQKFKFPREQTNYNSEQTTNSYNYNYSIRSINKTIAFQIEHQDLQIIYFTKDLREKCIQTKSTKRYKLRQETNQVLEEQTPKNNRRQISEIRPNIQKLTELSEVVRLTHTKLQNSTTPKFVRVA